ncbi:hypothetical protein [Streptomyces cucumeris]|uniref:hypothetical protein n=1 Tax=Streptomyces cucumeris TaxID=2962890 RepID=UPI0020C92416|nr:hypothetical protein [Streptomyces sp. NEAU-Y11]MCP9205532.1 hypothetical protein [Streptomyces sp. NEAU-Y11]
MNTTSRADSRAVEQLNLLATLRIPVHGDYWITAPTPGRQSLIAPVQGRLVWLHLVTVRALLDAESAGLITVGPVQPMPEYRGGGRHHWRAGLYGHVAALA